MEYPPVSARFFFMLTFLCSSRSAFFSFYDWVNRWFTDLGRLRVDILEDFG